jgi:SagB-type dehydrogenase family enzyme
VTKLPKPKLEGPVSVEEALRKRRSVRSFSGRELSLEEISQLCWSAQGVTEERMGFRAAPSAGATYPLELYVLTGDGVFRYDPDAHALERKQKRDRRADLARAALDQRFVAEAPVVLLMTAFYERTARGYGTRAGRYVHMEIGHAAQNVHLQAVALGLGSVPVGAFTDEEVARVLDLHDDESPLYIVPVGHANDEPADRRGR